MDSCMKTKKYELPKQIAGERNRCRKMTCLNEYLLFKQITRIPVSYHFYTERDNLTR